MALFFVQFPVCSLSIVNVFTILDTNRLLPSIFQAFLRICLNKYYNLTFYSNFSTPTNCSEELEPMFVIHNISMATADDVTYFGDNVKYIPCIFTLGNYHFGMLSQLFRKDYCFRLILLSICCKLIWELTHGH